MVGNFKPLSIDDTSGNLTDIPGTLWVQRLIDQQVLDRQNICTVSAMTQNLSERLELAAMVASQGDGYELR